MNLKRGIAFTVAAILIVFTVLTSTYFTIFNDSDGKMTVYYSNGLMGSAEKTISRKVSLYYNDDGELETGFQKNKLVSIASSGFKRAGYSATSWRLSNSDEVVQGEYVPEGLSKNDGIITFVPVWNAEQYVLSFNPEYPGLIWPQNLPVTYDEPIVGIEDRALANQGDLTFSGWRTQKNGKGTLVSDGEAATFTSNAVLYAWWTSADDPAATYLVTGVAKSSVMGSVTPSKTSGAVRGETITVTATPNSSHYVVDWEVTNAEFATGTSTSLERDIVVSGSGNVTVTVTFSTTAPPPQYYTVAGTASPTTAGLVTPLKTSGTITGEEVTVHTLTYAGYQISRWEITNGTFVDGTDASSVRTISVGEGNVEVTVIYISVPEYQIVFNGNGHTSGDMASQSLTYGQSSTLSTNTYARTSTVFYDYNGGTGTPVSETARYSFLCWNTRADGSGAAFSDGQTVTNLTTVGSTFTLYAMWTSSAITLPTATRTGMYFTGWYTTATGGTLVGMGGASYVPTAGVTLFAQWSNTAPIVSYQVAFNGNGSTSGSMTSQSHTTGQIQALSSNTYTRTSAMTINYAGGSGSSSIVNVSYSFLNWSTSANGNGVNYSDGQLVTNLMTTEGTYTLYAQWSAQSSAVTLPVPTRSGYTFEGWYTDTGLFISYGGTSYIPVGTTSIVAHWAVNVNSTYTVVFNGNGNTGGSMAAQTHEVNAYSALSMNNFTRVYTVTYNYNGGSGSVASENANYAFSHWSTTATGTGTAYTNGQTVSNLRTTAGSFDLWAQWTPGQVALPTPVRNGYVFDGWYTATIGGTYLGHGGATFTPTANAAIYAIWSLPEVNYTVTFEGNGSTAGSTASQTHTVDQSKALTSNGYSRTQTYPLNFNGGTGSPSSVTASYPFTNWNTNSSGTGTAYSNGQSVSNLRTTAGTFYLYAQWSAQSSAVTLPVPTRSGYTFTGWYTQNGAYISAGGSSYVPLGTTSIIAYWEKDAINYTVAFSGNGNTGGSTADQTHTVDQSQSLRANGYTRSYIVSFDASGGSVSTSSATSNYTFTGWNTSSSGSGTSYSNGQYVTNLRTSAGTFYLYAQWNAVAVTLPTPTLSGYTFNGWYTSSYGGTLVGAGGSSYIPTSTTTLYAQWSVTAVNYTVAFNGNGNTGGSTASQTHTVNQAQTLRSNGFTRAYTVSYDTVANGGSVSPSSATATSSFGSWNTNSSGTGTAYYNGQNVTNLRTTAGTVTLYAQWNAGAVSLPTPTLSGYTFNGWYTAASGGSYVGVGGASYVPTANTTLYAHWTQNTVNYTVAYAGNGNTGGSTASQTHTVNQSQALRSNGFTRAYTVSYSGNGGSVSPSSATATSSFGSWNTNSSGTGTAYYNGQSVTNLRTTAGTVTLYAQWNTGAVSLPTPTHSGYTFNGWYTSSSGGSYVGSGGTTYTPSSATTLYAQWTQNTVNYTVAYAGNGNTSGSTASQTHTVGQYQNLRTNGFARAYTVSYNANGGSVSTSSATATSSFRSWNTTSSGTGTSYSNSQSVTNLRTTAGTVTLYAQWNAGTVSLPTPTRSGYTFNGWYTSSSGGSYVGSGGTTYTPSSATTLYAQWTQNAVTYTVAYAGNGNTGGSTASQTHTVGQYQNLSTNGFTRAFTVSYSANNGSVSTSSATATSTFRNWGTSSSGGTTYSSGQSVTNLRTSAGTVTLYAQWSNGSVTLPRPTRGGYTFNGWYTSTSGGTKVGVANATYTPSSSITLYAQWTYCCFTAESGVLTAGGVKAIESVNIGDLVYTKNVTTGAIELKYVTGITTSVQSELVNVRSADGDVISSTGSHPYFVENRGWVQAGDLRSGDILVTVNGRKVIVEQVQHVILAQPQVLYNLEVAGNDNFFVAGSIYANVEDFILVQSAAI